MVAQYHLYLISGCLVTKCMLRKSHFIGTVCPLLGPLHSNWTVLVLLLYCLFSAVQCEQLSAPSNGFFKAACDKVYNSVCEFDCNTGYNLVGSSSRRCQSDKTWSGTAVQCNSKFSVVMMDFSSANCRRVPFSIHPFIDLSIQPFIHSFIIHSFIHSFNHSSIHPSMHVSIHPSIHLAIYSSIHLFNNPSILSSTNSFVSSSVHSCNKNLHLSL